MSERRKGEEERGEGEEAIKDTEERTEGGKGEEVERRERIINAEHWEAGSDLGEGEGGRSGGVIVIWGSILLTRQDSGQEQTTDDKFGCPSRTVDY